MILQALFTVASRWTLFLFLSLSILAPSPLFAASGLFPKMPPATNAFVFDISNDGGNAKMTAWCLQGVVNQKSAQVYLINNPWDVEPLQRCGRPFVNVPALTGTNAGLRTLFQKFQGRVERMFIYDPQKDWTWYLALMSASQQNGIAVTEPIQHALASEFGWKGEVQDYRAIWSTRIQAYD